MPKKIYLIRHGQTGYNKLKKFQGAINTRLTKEGIDQAKKLSQRLKGEPIETIISSDLSRAKRTAQELAKVIGKTIQYTPLLREQHLGILEGTPYDGTDTTYPGVWQGILQSWQDIKYQHYRGHQGETVAEMFKRIQTFIDQLESEHEKETVAVVTHGGITTRFLTLLNLNPYGNHIHFGNTSLTILNRVGDKYELELLADTSHLL